MRAEQGAAIILFVFGAASFYRWLRWIGRMARQSDLDGAAVGAARLGAMTGRMALRLLVPIIFAGSAMLLLALTRTGVAVPGAFAIAGLCVILMFAASMQLGLYTLMAIQTSRRLTADGDACSRATRAERRAACGRPSAHDTPANEPSDAKRLGAD